MTITMFFCVGNHHFIVVILTALLVRWQFIVLNTVFEHFTVVDSSIGRRRCWYCSLFLSRSIVRFKRVVLHSVIEQATKEHVVLKATSNIVIPWYFEPV